MESVPLTPEEIIRRLELVVMPDEGGFYRETYRSPETVAATDLPPRYRAAKALSTCIYYLLTPDVVSRLHRVTSDEIFHFYLGDPVEMLQLLPDGASRRLILGSDLRNGHALQAVVPQGVWQGSRLVPGGAWALLGTTVAPGFDFADYERGDGRQLALRYPSERELVESLGG